MRLYSPDDEYCRLSPEDLSIVRKDEEITDTVPEEKPVSFFKDAAIRFAKNKASITALIVILIIAFFAAFGPDMNDFSFKEQHPDYINMPPYIPALSGLGIFDGSYVLQNRRMDALSDPAKYPNDCVLEVMDEREVRGVMMCDVRVNYYKYMDAPQDLAFWFGSDYLGRDLWTRMWRGARVSLLIAVLSVLSNVFIGIIYGSIAGYYGGRTDMIMMRITEIIGAMPNLVMVTLFIMFFGAGILSIVLALLLQNWIGTARMIRAQFYRYKGYEYVLAARTLGVKDRSLIFRHILPNAIGPIITRAMVAIPGAIFTESFLAYLGLGIQAPETSIGILLADGQKVLQQFPSQVLFPSVLISVLMVAFNLLSNGLRDAFDPTQSGT